MRIVPAKNGWLWVRDGARIFSRGPVLWMLLIFSYYLATSLISSLPVVGMLLGIVLVPVLSVSFYNISRDCEQGKTVTPKHLLSGFRDNLPAVLNLGGLYLLALIGVLGLSWIADDGGFARMLIVSRRPESLDYSGAVVACVALIPVFLSFWFAPALAAWQRMSAVQALFYSFFAAVRNWRAMLVYFAVLIGTLFLVGLFVGVVVGTLAPARLEGVGAAPSRGPGAFLVFVMLPAVLCGLAILFASFYTSYRDVFAEHIESPPLR